MKILRGTIFRLLIGRKRIKNWNAGKGFCILHPAFTVNTGTGRELPPPQRKLIREVILTFAKVHEVAPDSPTGNPEDGLIHQKQ